jgi:hypothetical protein
MNLKQLKALIKESVQEVLEAETSLELIDEDNLQESGFSKILHTLSGGEKSIDTVGILTSENPMGQQIPESENKPLRKALEKDLRELGLGFRKLVGKYGSIENSYFVPNMSKKDVIALGTKYNQDSIIFGQKKIFNGKPGMEFSLIFTGGTGAPTLKTKEFIPLDSSEEDFYSVFKGKKFRLGF